ncbi:MAG: type II toxin-antitoxin system VapC family toxin [Meiothermus silvanus]|nr:type II toxin-antitoxin system VapC family toxin [Allomeiothermus silvanus]
MLLYLDTSALVKLYVSEEASDAVRAEVSQAAAVSTSRVAYAEARAAFARRTREGALSGGDLRRIVAALDADWESYLSVEVTDGIARQAGELAERYALRALDSLHLASALALQRRVSLPLRFLCFDQRLARAAQEALGS